VTGHITAWEKERPSVGVHHSEHRHFTHASLCVTGRCLSGGVWQRKGIRLAYEETLKTQHSLKLGDSTFLSPLWLTICWYVDPTQHNAVSQSYVYSWVVLLSCRWRLGLITLDKGAAPIVNVTRRFDSARSPFSLSPTLLGPTPYAHRPLSLSLSFAHPLPICPPLNLVHLAIC
jgi:hypothetical protein